MPTSQQFLLDRRKHPRHPIEAQITALFSEFWRVVDPNGLLGWTHNVSEGGVCFSLPFRIPAEELVLHIDYDGMGAEYMLATIIRAVDRQEDGWQYHCRIDRTLVSVDPFGVFDELILNPVASGQV